MNKSDLYYDLPDHQIALTPMRPSRILMGFPDIKELNKTELFSLFKFGDVLVLNETRVVPKRIILSDRDILFLETLGDCKYKILMQSRDLSLGDYLELPGGVNLKLVQKSLPQIGQTNIELTEEYFQRWGELPLPPYIQKHRPEYKNLEQDKLWYQSAWARDSGSVAAPTASLHFSLEDLYQLESMGVRILKICLHVGLGTFLPVKVANLSEHKMHQEDVSISVAVWEQILIAKQKGHSVWALGTTVARALESAALNYFSKDVQVLEGKTDLMILPGFEFKIIDGLLTNFHQPESTLLALVAAFADLESVKEAYCYALKNNFRFLSYGDLSVWSRK